MTSETESEGMCGVLLKFLATAQVFLFVLIEDLWFLNLALNLVVVIQRIGGCMSCNGLNR